MTDSTDLPDFLQDIESLRQHLASSLDIDSSEAKGDAFVALAQRTVPLFDEVGGFGPLQPSEKKTHDKGVDLRSGLNDEQVRLCVQSKYRINSVAEYDAVVSAFRNYEEDLRTSVTQELFPDDAQERAPVFAVFTSSDVSNIIRKYLATAHASIDYYNQLRREGRIYEFDGRRLLSKLRELWRRTYVIPRDIELESHDGWLVPTGNAVAIGIISTDALSQLYSEHGESIFFENIREYLGSQTEVNRRIRHTISDEPERLLERNNGITFRAHSFRREGDTTLHLSKGAIVNGCQTTMSAVQVSRLRAPENKPLKGEVQVKVVSATDAWEVANAANYQNTVSRIDLELAKWLRPQLMKRAAAFEGIAITPSDDSTHAVESVGALLDTFYDREMRQDQVRSLFLGLFSASPNDLFANNYERLKGDVVSAVYDEGDEQVQLLFSTLFQMVEAGEQARRQCEMTFGHPNYQSLFKRFHEPARPYYSAYMTIVALALATETRLDEKLKSEEDVDRTNAFIDASRDVLTNDLARFSRCYAAVYSAISNMLLDVGSDVDVAQVMFRKIQQKDFSAVLQMAQVQLDFLSSAW